MVACAGGTEQADEVADSAPSRNQDCIFQSSIRDYQVLDDRNLIVNAGGKRTYHVELSRRAFGLRSNWSIGFRSPTGRLCPGFGEVIVDDGFDRAEAIRVSTIRAVDPDELDEILVRFGKKEPEYEEPPPEEDVQGAEVEELD